MKGLISLRPIVVVSVPADCVLVAVLPSGTALPFQVGNVPGYDHEDVNHAVRLAFASARPHLTTHIEPGQYGT